MAIGERIRFFRNMKGITQKYLGMVVGFPERSADVRMAQYETGSRTPKADLTKTLADFFDIRLDKSKGKTYANMLDMLSAWAEQAKKLEAGEITREDYDRWRYNYPKYDTTLRWAKVPSQELSDFLVDALKDSPDTDE